MNEDANTEYTWRSLLPRLSMDYPYWALGIVFLGTLIFAMAFPLMQINTDPEDMLPYDHPARETDRQIKDRFHLHDFVAIGLAPPANSTQFSTNRLERVNKLITFIEKQDGVISQDIISIYTSDDVEGIEGGIQVDRLARRAPDDTEKMNHLIDRVQDHPILDGLILNSKSGGIAVFAPIESKKFSYELRQSIRSFWNSKFESAGKMHVTGLPVAEKTFGVQMFYQMMTSAPLAFVLIGILLYWFFRSGSLVFWTLVQAVFLVVWTMGGMIYLGYTVHIMSSMIPIFLLPIAVVDSIHILSDYTERMQTNGNRKQVLSGVFEELFFAIFFTSLTSLSGFASLALTGIPPVQVFGIAVGLGIFLDFVMEIVVLPAGIQLWHPQSTIKARDSWIGKVVSLNGYYARNYSSVFLAVGLIAISLGLYGMQLIQVNDNPTKWFEYEHPIRKADRYFNSAFAGSYPAYWVLEKKERGWYDPNSLKQLDRLTTKLESMPEVGKVTALPGLVQKIHREIRGNTVKSSYPSSTTAVRQYLFLYENSGNPQDLFRLVSPDASEINVWFNLKNGDNRVMANVMDEAESILKKSDLKLNTKPEWGGITVVNLIWQNVMVRGMGWALASSCLVIYFMLFVLFRDIRWATLAMVPLTFTLVIVYGVIGWIGKDYDMPVAVLSALSIGIGVDFAIHFIQRGREILHKTGDWQTMIEKISGEPARAIARNIIVVSLGFTPLLVAPLRPYVTVGIFMIVILTISGIATLTGLTASLEQFEAFFTSNSED